MIIVFHNVFLLVQRLVREYKRLKFLKELDAQRMSIEYEVNKHTSIIIDSEKNVKFDPPVYKLRYEAVQRVLLDEKWRSEIHKIVDFGCAEFGLFIYLKRLFGINEIIEVDIDEELLKENTIRLRPLTVDYLKRRPEPLTLKVYAGSVSDPDPVLLGTDAVIAVELIEHLYPDVLDAVPYNVFSFIKPRIAVFTTPNSEFNEVFLKSNKFRHDDHKFEWTREQFESWAYNITDRFPDYSVSFAGIGNGPAHLSHLGHCSQMAIFVRNYRNEDLEQNPREPIPRGIFVQKNASKVEQHVKFSKGDFVPDRSHGICCHRSYSEQICNYQLEEEGVGSYYKLIEVVEYPFNECMMSKEELLLSEIQYKIHTLGRVFGRYFNDDRNRAEIPLEDLTYNDDGPFITMPELMKLLAKIGYKVKECNAYKSKNSLPCVIYEPVMESSSSPTSEANPSDFDNWPTEDEGNISDWDAPGDKHNWPSHSQNKNANSQIYASEVLFDIIKSLESPKEGPEGAPANGLADSGYQKSVSNLGSPETPQEVNCTEICVQDEEKPKEKEINEANVSKNGIYVPRTAQPNKSVACKQNYIIRHTDNKQTLVENLKKEVRRDQECSKDVTNEALFSRAPPKPPPLPKKKENKEPLPGTSKRKKNRKSECEDDTVHEDMRNFAECVVINALNKVEDPRAILIEEARPAEEIAPPILVEEIEPPAVVENGDLVNNNRDIEGNNYPDEGANDNLANENVEENAEADIRNQDFQNRNEAPPAPEPPAPNAEAFGAEQANADFELAFASREALYDPNSQTDLLDDFDIPPIAEENGEVPQEEPAQRDQQTVILVGVLHADEEDGVILPGHPDPFPNWLLQLLGAEYIEDGNQHDEPHFYCQGDGVARNVPPGVHPSVIEVDIDEEPSTSEDSSSNTTNEDPEAERTVSDQEVGSLPEDVTDNSQAVANDTLRVDGQAVANPTPPSVVERPGPSNNDSTEEFFDSLEDTSVEKT